MGVKGEAIAVNQSTPVHTVRAEAVRSDRQHHFSRDFYFPAGPRRCNALSDFGVLVMHTRWLLCSTEFVWRRGQIKAAAICSRNVKVLQRKFDPDRLLSLLERPITQHRP